MDQSYFTMLLLLVRKSKQPGFFKSEKSLGLKECNLCLPPSMSICEDVRSRDQLNETILCSVVGRIKVLTERIFLA